MNIRLKDNQKQAIVDIEVNKNSQGIVDLKSVVAIEPYSDFLIENIDKKEEIIADFGMIDELRGWLWEYYDIKGDKNDLSAVTEELRTMLGDIARKYELFYQEG